MVLGWWFFQEEAEKHVSELQKTHKDTFPECVFEIEKHRFVKNIYEGMLGDNIGATMVRVSVPQFDLDGITIASPSTQHQFECLVHGLSSGTRGHTQLDKAARGDGLPSQQVNEIVEAVKLGTDIAKCVLVVSC